MAYTVPHSGPPRGCRSGPQYWDQKCCLSRITSVLVPFPSHFVTAKARFFFQWADWLEFMCRARHLMPCWLNMDETSIAKSYDAASGFVVVKKKMPCGQGHPSAHVSVAETWGRDISGTDIITRRHSATATGRGQLFHDPAEGSAKIEAGNVSADFVLATEEQLEQCRDDDAMARCQLIRV